MFTITPNGLDEALQRLSQVDEAKLRRALRSAVMRTLRGARQDAGRKIAQRYTIAAGKVTKTIKVFASDLSGEMKSKGPLNPLKWFVVRPKSRPKKMPPGGVFVMNVRGQGGFLRRAFLGKSGAVLEREGMPRYPIKARMGPSSPGMLSSPQVAPFIVRKMEERLAINIEHEVAALGFF